MKKNIVRSFLFILGILTFTQCDDYFETKTDDMLLDKDYVGSVNELYSGYMGVAAKVQAVADQAIFLTELRGDLLEPTTNAPQELWDIYNHTDAKGNSFTDPKGYYDVIMNANDFIKKALEYKGKNPNAIDSAIFKPMISMTLRFKVWAYLMLAKTYGQAVYLDEPVQNYEEVNNLPVLQFDELIQKCLSLMETGVIGIDGKNIDGKRTMVWSTLLAQGETTGVDLTWDMICPTPEALLCELNLWAGNYQKVVDIAIPYIYDNGSKRYKLNNDDYNGEWCQFFYASPTTRTRELITVVPYDYSKNQTNRLISFFSNTFPSKYYLRPTQVAMDRFNNQVQLDGLTPTDRYRGNTYTFTLQNGEWVIRKFTKNRESATTIYKNDVHIVLYRAADIHLFLAEALNQLEKFPEAEAILNDGIEAYLSKYAGKLRAPFDNPTYNSIFGINWGVRRRVNLAPAINLVQKSGGIATYNHDQDTVRNYQDSIMYKKAFDEALVEETCMESAGEARSYFAMIRIAKRWNDPAILADRVSAKYSGGQKEAIRQLLMNKENWFVKDNLEK